MLLKQVLEMYELLDRADASGEKVEKFLRSRGAKNVSVQKVEGDKGSTDFIKILIPGKNGKSANGDAKTLGVIGRLGGLGARDTMIGFVSDGDGALTALSVALKLIDMQNAGDYLDSDVIVTTHICPDAPTQDHDPVPFMDSPVDMQTMNKVEVVEEMDAILAIDTTKGNEVITHKGFAISPTVKEGYILPFSKDLLQIMKRVTGILPATFALSQQDITPYENNLYHLNSILQPATASSSPVVGVAITTEVPVAGCATGASHPIDIEVTARFAIEVAKEYGRGKCEFYDHSNFERLIQLYGENKHFQTVGRL